MANRVMKRSDMAMPTAARGADVAKRLESLKGRSRGDLAGDMGRGASSPLGARSHSMAEAKKEKRR